MTNLIQKEPKIVRRKQVQSQTGLSRSSIYQMIADGKFPQSIKLGQRSVGWVQGEIDAWINARIESSRKVEVA